LPYQINAFFKKYPHSFSVFFTTIDSERKHERGKKKGTENLVDEIEERERKGGKGKKI
jgi:hypothetical protein